MRYFVCYWMPVILYAGLIFTISSFPLPPAKVEIPFLDKFVHLTEYGILGFLFYRALRVSRFPLLSKVVSARAQKASQHSVTYLHPSGCGTSATKALEHRRPPTEAKRVFILATLFSILYAVTDEVHQYFVPGREFDFWDLAADSLGATLVAIYLRYSKRR